MKESKAIIIIVVVMFALNLLILYDFLLSCWIVSGFVSLETGTLSKIESHISINGNLKITELLVSVFSWWDGQDGSGLQLEEVGPTFSSRTVLSWKSQ